MGMQVHAKRYHMPHQNKCSQPCSELQALQHAHRHQQLLKYHVKSTMNQIHMTMHKRTQNVVNQQKQLQSRHLSHPVLLSAVSC